MPKLAIDKAFLNDLVKLDKPVAKRVTEVFDEFGSATHTGLHLEKIKNARNPRFRSIRIDQGWRGIVLAPDSGDVYTLLKVLPHDDAYKWAERSNISVNTATGGIEIRDEAGIEEALPALERTAESTESHLFGGFSDSDLQRLGIDDQTLQFARALTTVEQLDAAKHKLPDTQWDVLFGLAAGYTAEEVWGDMSASILGEPVDVSDLDSAILRSPNRVALVEDRDELLKAFAYPFASWRVYLHPSQRRVAEAAFTGPARVTGGPGTGKTVVALHRAHNLAKRNDGRVLLTTFTATLSDALQSGLDMIVDDEDVEDRIDIIHIDKLAHRVFRKQHRSPKILSADEETQIWQSVIEEQGLSVTETILASEWRHVALALPVASKEDYFAAKHSAKGRDLTSHQVADAWKGIHSFEESLSQLGAWTHDTVRREATRLLIEAPAKPYRHIVVDEAQDLTADQWRLLRAATPEEPDDLFMAGDTHQRIYDNHVTLNDVGINIGDRSAELSLNYRTTAEILGWGIGLLRGEPIDDMNGGLDSIARCRSAVHGAPPRLLGLASSQAEEQCVAEAVRDWISEGIDPSEIGIATRTRWLGSKIAEVLRSEGIPTFDLAQGLNLDGAVSVGTMHRMKGLEFRCVAVAGVGAKLVPEPNAVTSATLDKDTHNQDIEREKCLLFVACTRAREELLVTWHGEPSSFLRALGPID
jgi:hypothetical protein